MQTNCEIIQSDSLIQMINTSNELDQLTNKWMFETEVKPSEPQKKTKRTKMLKQDQKLDDSIIKKNQELFNINFSKSTYINKINSLIDTNKLKKQQKKILKNQRKFDSIENFSNEDLDDSNKLKLAKNRQSARDSRKRKKIYVELLEIKVQALTKQIETLQKSLDEQNNFINHSVKIPSLISDFNINYQNTLKALIQINSISQLINFDSEFGVKSCKRDCLCNTIFNTLIDHILPFDLKKTIETAVNDAGIFSPEVANTQIKEQQVQLVKQFKQLELAIFDMAKYYEQIQKEAKGLEKIKHKLINIAGPQKFLQNVIDVHVTVKEEDQFIEQ